MTKDDDDAIRRLEAEMVELETPILDVVDAIYIVGNALEIELMPLINRVIENETEYTPHETIIVDLIYAALENSSQLQEIKRAVEIVADIAALEED